MNDMTSAVAYARESLAVGQFVKAEAICQQILMRSPGHAEATYITGIAAFRRGDTQTARAYLLKAITVAPLTALFHSSLGAVLDACGDRNGAIASFRKATDLAPELHEGWLNLGITLFKAEKIADAQPALERAVHTAPRSVDAHIFLALALDGLGKPEEALPVFERVIELAPEIPDAYLNIVAIHRLAGRNMAAIDVCERAIAASHTLPWFVEMLGVLRLKIGEYRGCRDILRRTTSQSQNNPKMHSVMLMSLLYDPSVSPKQIRESATEWNNFYARPCVPVPRTRTALRRIGPIRVGYLSSDFLRHPIGYFLQGVLQAHNRVSFHVTCYSDVKVADDLTERLKGHADAWIDVKDLDDDALARRIAHDGIDILVDLAGHTANNRLLVCARRPAPVQVTWLGYPATTGLSAIDYLISDHNETPLGVDDNYTETLIRLPDGYLCYVAPDYAPDVGPLPALGNNYVTFGCFNNLSKLNDTTFVLWAQILGRIPSSRLLLITSGLEEPRTAARIQAAFRSRGIDAERIILRGAIQHEQLLQSYNEIDIALDPMPYSGGLTTCESLWMGVPVVALSGSTFAARHSTSHLANVGLTEFVTQTSEQYICRAINIAGDIDRLAALRAGLRKQMAASPLCDTNRFTRNLEQAMEMMLAKSLDAVGTPEDGRA